MAQTSTSRRTFLKAAAGTAGLALSMPAASYGRVLGANERIRVGIIGMGRQSRGHLQTLLDMSEVEVAALCDVYEPNLSYASEQAPAADAYADFRRVLERSDIDAVVIGTPDHWHALPTVRACEAGKDVYVEKPTSRTITEGRRMVEAARRYDRVVQVGTQQRSAPHFQRAVEIVRSGRLGQVSFVRTWNYGNAAPSGIGDPPDEEPPPGLDWEMWLGPAPRVPYNRNRFGVLLDEDGNYSRWASFRWFWDYAGGMMTDWGVHLLDIVQWAMDENAPRAVSASGGTFCLQDNRDTPDTLNVSYQYSDFVCTYENRVCNGRPLDGRSYGIMFHGTEGTLFVDRGGYALTPEEGSDVVPTVAESVGSSRRRHLQDFVDSIKARRRPISDIEIGHRSSSTAILGNLAFRAGERVVWDGGREEPVGAAIDSPYLRHDYRRPWKL